jgi:hypothetical protein
MVPYTITNQIIARKNMVKYFYGTVPDGVSRQIDALYWIDDMGTVVKLILKRPPYRLLPHGHTLAEYLTPYLNTANAIVDKSQRVVYCVVNNRKRLQCVTTIRSEAVNYIDQHTSAPHYYNYLSIQEIYL